MLEQLLSTSVIVDQGVTPTPAFRMRRSADVRQPGRRVATLMPVILSSSCGICR
jgi:hypothetical protein